MEHLNRLAIIDQMGCHTSSIREIFSEFFQVSGFSKIEEIPATTLFDVCLFVYPDQNAAKNELRLMREMVNDCELVNIWIEKEAPLDTRPYFEIGLSDILVGGPCEWEFRSRARLWLKAVGSTRTFRGLKVDQHQLTITGPNGNSVKLTHKEIQILSTFMMSKNSRVSRSAILEFVWKGVVVGRKTLDVHIFNLRKKLSQVGIEIQFLPPSDFELVMPKKGKKKSESMLNSGVRSM